MFLCLLSATWYAAPTCVPDTGTGTMTIDTTTNIMGVAVNLIAGTDLFR